MRWGRRQLQEGSLLEQECKSKIANNCVPKLVFEHPQTGRGCPVLGTAGLCLLTRAPELGWLQPVQIISFLLPFWYFWGVF